MVAGLETDVGIVVLQSAGSCRDGPAEDGSPIQDAVVTATTHPDTLLDLDQDPGPFAPEPPFFATTTITDLAGHFRLPGVPPGLVAIRVTAVGLPRAHQRTWVPPQATSPGWVDVVAPAGVGPARARGRVEVAALPDVPVSVGTWEDPRFVALVEGKTDEKGVYELSGFLRMPSAALVIPTARGGARLLFRDAGGGRSTRPGVP